VVFLIFQVSISVILFAAVTDSEEASDILDFCAMH